MHLFSPPGSDGAPLDSNVASTSEENYSPSASACLSSKCTMGYSIITVLAGTEYRYTEW